MEKEKNHMEKEKIEKELSYLLERTFKMEDELNSLTRLEE
jgi:hypothetical protein